MVNQDEQECFEYFILRTKWDARWTITGFTGLADVYLSPRTFPEDGPKDKNVRVRAGFGSSTSIIISA